MIMYNPTDGDAMDKNMLSRARHCFLMTQLGVPISEEVLKIIKKVKKLCNLEKYTVIDATEDVTGRDFLVKIWKYIYSSGVSIGLCHEQIPMKTQLNIYYEIGVAQAMGKESLIIKSKNAQIPSDLVRTEYIVFDNSFDENFKKFLQAIEKQAEHYVVMAEQLENNPVLTIDYLRRAFLITGDIKLRKKAKDLIVLNGLSDRAKNSVENLLASF